MVLKTISPGCGVQVSLMLFLHSLLSPTAGRGGDEDMIIICLFICLSCVHNWKVGSTCGTVLSKHGPHPYHISRIAYVISQQNPHAKHKNSSLNGFRSQDIVSGFKSHLKTYLFRQVYPSA